MLNILFLAAVNHNAASITDKKKYIYYISIHIALGYGLPMGTKLPSR